MSSRRGFSVGMWDVIGVTAFIAVIAAAATGTWWLFGLALLAFVAVLGIVAWRLSRSGRLGRALGEEAPPAVPDELRDSTAAVEMPLNRAQRRAAARGKTGS